MNFFYFIKENKIITIIISIILNVILLILTITFVYLYFNYECKCDGENINDEILNCPSIEEEKEEFYVEIKGAVQNPGVYKVNTDNIINDLITFSGGLNKDAYTDNINLSKKVSKELVVYVYTTKEIKSNTAQVKQTVCKCPTYEISKCVEEKSSEIVNGNANTSDNTDNIDNNINDNETVTNQSNIININTASLSELMNLSGIGESKAKEIINYRTTKGSFKDIEEIKNVSGIGEKIFEKIKNNITV